MRRPKPERCAQCNTIIAQPATGRPRQLCASPDCRRAADALRRRLLRRRRAAIPQDSWRQQSNREPVRHGGRDSLLRRLAKRLAGAAFPYARATAEELMALERAIQAGAVSSDDLDHIARGRPSTTYPPLDPVTPETRSCLKGLIERNTAHDPIRERHQKVMAQLRDDPKRALRVFGTTNEAILAQLVMRLLRSDPDGRLALLMTDDEAGARLEDAGLVPDRHGAWVRAR